MELLREFMKLQKDMMIMLLSMLEGLLADFFPTFPFHYRDRVSITVCNQPHRYGVTQC